ncbi:acylneuraminate cytidylyltransferase family protein [Amylibacter sp.]|nr:acylneuraminate cytidylyltransferase family protein [Amylibacter sp.]
MTIAKHKKILGLIPARAGSKGIKDKNIIPVLGKPLIGYACEAAKKSTCFDELILSSNSEKIISVAKDFGIDVPFIRPDEISADDTLIVDVIYHALKWFETNREINFDYVCLIQPTAPLAVKEDYENAVQTALENDADTVITVYKCGQMHPSVMYLRDDNGKVNWFVENLGWDQMSRRQDLPPVYMRSGIVYVFKASQILHNRELYGDRVFSIEVEEERGAVDINTEIDLKIAELLLSNRAK